MIAVQVRSSTSEDVTPYNDNTHENNGEQIVLRKDRKHGGLKERATNKDKSK